MSALSLIDIRRQYPLKEKHVTWFKHSLKTHGENKNINNYDNLSQNAFKLYWSFSYVYYFRSDKISLYWVLGTPTGIRHGKSAYRVVNASK